MPRKITDPHRQLTGLENAIALLQYIHRLILEQTSPDGDPATIAECETVLHDAVQRYLTAGDVSLQSTFHQPDGTRLIVTFGMALEPDTPEGD